MKKLYSFFATIFTVVAIYSQSLLTIVQTPANSGIYTITYNDSANGWAFYNPGVGNPIGVYLWLNGADNSTGSPFNDNFSNITAQLTWDGTNYSGTIDLNTHNFNKTGGVLPAGTTVTELHFLFIVFFWYKGLALGGIAKIGQIQLIQPFIGLMLCAFLLNEQISLLMIVISLAVMGCVVMAKKHA